MNSRDRECVHYKQICQSPYNRSQLFVSTHLSTDLTTLQPSPTKTQPSSSSTPMGGDSSGSVPLALLIGVTIALLGATILVFFVFLIINMCRRHNRKGCYSATKYYVLIILLHESERYFHELPVCKIHAVWVVIMYPNM